MPRLTFGWICSPSSTTDALRFGNRDNASITARAMNGRYVSPAERRTRSTAA